MDLDQEPETGMDTEPETAGDDHVMSGGSDGQTPISHPSESHNSSGITMVGPPDDDPDRSSSYFNSTEASD
jgi:hypothetical protein